MTLEEPTQEAYAKLGRYAAALLGSAREWECADICSELAEVASRYEVPALGDQGPDELKLWRGVADSLRISYEDDEEYEEEEEDGTVSLPE